ncbi:carbohydrate ABC transporter permease, partial [Rhizobium ruizarguesonis]
MSLREEEEASVSLSNSVITTDGALATSGRKVAVLSKRQRRIRNALVAYSFIAPNFIGFAVFTLCPILFAFVLAFMHWDGSNAITFAGLDNFWRLFEDKAFIAAFWNTVIYTV